MLGILRCPTPLFVGCQGFLGFCDLLFVCRTDPSSDDEYELFQLFERYYQICQEMSFPLPQGTYQLTAPFFQLSAPFFQLSAPFSQLSAPLFQLFPTLSTICPILLTICPTYLPFQILNENLLPMNPTCSLIHTIMTFDKF